LSVQKPEGYWIGELIVDCTLVADMIGVPPLEQARSMRNGSAKLSITSFRFNCPPAAGAFILNGPAEINATVKAYVALKLAGVPMTDPRMLRARQTALSLGGVPAHEHLLQIYLALLGLFPGTTCRPFPAK
jgi:squalene-hopene/tetraprenyl-beta-curcumene cyclase